ncbi:putative inactive ATP-dependent zinc metalloprotease FTSHI 1, chloroplastic [Apium graveolens]|uniref:putative inactive ATP-dependent zinc metalloprotease FTSHI 1, chloroplastic n=1 Tax=Apium graveolens TaxID=4045 RepID=UPI003D7AD987
MTRFHRLNFRGSKDGDVCVVDVKKMKICHWSKRLHSGSSIKSLEFCPNERRQGTFTDSKDQLYNAATQETETMLNQLLMELNGFDTGNSVIILGATNRKDLLDPALLQPGHFDRKIKISAPNAKGILAILKVHARKVKLSKSVDMSTYAQNLPGLSV